MYCLFLDDERSPDHVKWIKYPDDITWTVVRNYDEFTSIIDLHGLPELISFDHDLGYQGETNVYGTDNEKNGYHCAQYLVDHCLSHHHPLPAFFVHSQNPVGRENIQKLLHNFTTFYQNQTQPSSFKF